MKILGAMAHSRGSYICFFITAVVCNYNFLFWLINRNSQANIKAVDIQVLSRLRIITLVMSYIQNASML